MQLSNQQARAALERANGSASFEDTLSLMKQVLLEHELVHCAVTTADAVWESAS